MGIMGSIKINSHSLILPTSSSSSPLTSFQKCLLTPPSLLKQLKLLNNNREGEEVEIFVKIERLNKNINRSSIIGRCLVKRGGRDEGEEDSTGGVGVVKVDKRVVQLSSGNSDEDDDDVIANYLGEDDEGSLLNEDDEYEIEPIHHSSSSPGRIKWIRVRVISSSPLTQFLHHIGTRKPLSNNEDEHKSSFTSSWKLLRDRIRLVFQTYDIHLPNVKKGYSKCVIDLRGCPLSEGQGRVGSPPFSFLVVEELEFKAEEGKDVEIRIGRVTSKTEVLIDKVHHITHYQRRMKNKEEAEVLHLVSGQQDASIMLKSLLIPRKDQNFNFAGGLLIAGPSGCGKSLVVRETVRELKGVNLVVFNEEGATSDRGFHHGDVSALGERWTNSFFRALSSAVLHPTILLIPRVEDKLVLKNKNSTMKLVNHVCSLFDGMKEERKDHYHHPLVVVGTSLKPFLIPEKMRRDGRFQREVYIALPTEEERLRILKSLKDNERGMQIDDDVVERLSQRTPGYSAQDLMRVLHLAILKSYEEYSTAVLEYHVNYALSRVLPSALQGTLGTVHVPRYNDEDKSPLDNIAGLSSVKQELVKSIVWPLRYPEAFGRMGVNPPKGILLYSPPGCAKTTLVRAVASSYNTNFLSVSAAELFSSGVGDSEKIVVDLFHRARLASPCILFIDELEAIVGSRQMSKGNKSTNESILSMLLTEMDGIGTTAQISEKSKSSSYYGPSVLVVAATNRLDMIDSALIRPGRFDKLIHVPPLDERGRLELLEICGRKTPWNTDVNLPAIATRTEGYTGADIINLCREAALLSLTRQGMGADVVNAEDVEEAMKRIRPTLTR